MLSGRTYANMCTWDFKTYEPSPDSPTHVLYAIVNFRKLMCSEVSADYAKDLVDEHSVDITAEYLHWGGHIRYVC